MNLRQYLILGVTDLRLSDSVRISAFTRVFDALCAGMTWRAHTHYKASMSTCCLLVLRRPLRQLDDIPGRGERRAHQLLDMLARLRRHFEAHRFRFLQEP